MDIIPFSQNAIEMGFVAADALISIRSVSVEVAIDNSLFGNQVLKLEFDDIPALEWTDDKGHTYHGATEEQILSALEFSRNLIQIQNIDLIAVHCRQGKSRSSAIALAIMCDYLGPGREEEAVEQILRNDKENHFCFNPGIVRMADKLLGRNGKIEKALEIRSDSFRSWRTYWIRKGVIQ